MLNGSVVKRKRILIRPSLREAIDELVDSWDFKTKKDILRRMDSYDRRNITDLATLGNQRRTFWKWLWESEQRKKNISYLNNPALLNDWKERFKITGEQDINAQYDHFFRQDLGKEGIEYAIKKLREATSNAVVPKELGELLNSIYLKYICYEKSVPEGELQVPKAPLVMIIGQHGSGKSMTTREAIKEHLMGGLVSFEDDLSERLEDLEKEKPFARWYLDVEDPELAKYIEERKRRDKVMRWKDVPLLKKLVKTEIAEMVEGDENIRRPSLEWRTVEPSSVATAYVSEPVNLFIDAVGNLNKPAVIHLEEFHNLMRKYSKTGVNAGVEKSQVGTLITKFNEMLDRTMQGDNRVVWIATTNSPEDIEPEVYRRFDEQGIIIDIADFWKRRHYLKEIIQVESRYQDVTIPDMEQFAEGVNKVFKERSLTVTPTYVRKLVEAIATERDVLTPDVFEDTVLLRRAFQNVARNTHGDLYKRIVKDPPNDVVFGDYIGKVRNDYTAMANAALRYNDESEKGCILSGPPGSGKTFLSKVYAATNPDIAYIYATLDELQDPHRPIDGLVENVAAMYDIARMLAPSQVVINEADAIVPARRAGETNPYTKVTNTFLDILDGGIPLRGVFTVMTTNMQHNIDGALTRTGRLKRLEVTGRLNDREKKRLLEKSLEDTARSKEVTTEVVYEATKGLCHVPADYVGFVESMKGLRRSQYRVLAKLQEVTDYEDFVEQNSKAIIGILHYYNIAPGIIAQAKLKPKQVPRELLNELRERAQSFDDYPLGLSHLETAIEDFAQSPSRRSQQLQRQFLSYELSQEPQVGFVVGAGASDTHGTLVPIHTELTPSHESLLITGAVESGSPMGAELDMAVRMTHQSAIEAKTLTERYLAQLFAEQNHRVNVPWLVNQLLDGYAIHHQFLTANYMSGGPSAGFALSINTLSAILRLEVMNDFGITGAPWSGGVTKRDVGSSVIIGGAPIKTEVVLAEPSLRRMFLPAKNYPEISQTDLESYWAEGKLVRPVKSFRELVPEVYRFNDEYKALLEETVQTQIAYNIENANGETRLQSKLESLKNALTTAAEKEIVRRGRCLYNYVIEKSTDKFAQSFESIYTPGGRYDKLIA